MTLSVSVPNQTDWSSILANLAFAHGRPNATGRIKVEPGDFRVFEQMDMAPDGDGEHIWVQISKCRQNTEQVAKQLARFCHVAYRDVGYSGLKDYFAIAEQWFSVWLPKGESPDWSKFEMNGVSIMQTGRHHRKIRRGTHRGNRFSILVRDLTTADAPLLERLNLIQQCGVPNYFGPQRFGGGANNMQQAREMLNRSRNIRNSNLRGILLSAARSWLFNSVLSERLKAGTWQTLQHGEPANLDGSASVFSAEQTTEESERLLALDIHATGPLWGEINDPRIAAYRCLHDWEVAVLCEYKDIADGLCAARLGYQRRPLRMRVKQLEWQLSGDQLKLNFALQKGQFATSVLRELVADTPGQQ